MNVNLIYLLILIAIGKISFISSHGNLMEIFNSADFGIADENIRMKYAAHENLKKIFRDQTLYKLMAAMVTNQLKHQPEWFQRETEDCFQKADSINSYAQCATPVFMKRRTNVDQEINKLGEVQRKKRMIGKRRKLPQEFFRSKDGNPDVWKIPNFSEFRRSTQAPFVAPGGQIHIAEPEGQPLIDEHSVQTLVNGPAVQTLIDKSMVQKTGELMLNLVQQLKFEYGSWFALPDIDQMLNSNNLSIASRKQVNTKKLIQPKANEVYSTVDSLLNSRMIMLKDNVDFSQEGMSTMDLPKDDISFHFLSPRLMPMTERNDDRPAILSPDVFSLYKNGHNNIASVHQLLSNLTEQERKPWIDLLTEITGAADIMRYTQSVEFSNILTMSSIDAGNGVTMPVRSTFDMLNRTLGSIFEMMNIAQVSSLNSKGYAFMNRSQLSAVYGDKISRLKFDVDQFLTLSEDEKDLLITEEILHMTTPDNRRFKRQAPPTILAPYIGGTTLITYLLAPTILSPSVFSYIVLGPLVLSPYILSPYVFGPFILAPEVLTPFILSPYVLSPTILSPIVLGPSILSPIVLSPFILSPFVLSPSILSPTVLNPNILSPGVLGPAILSPVVLGPNILSPSVLNPAIDSPTVLSPAILSPGLLNPSVRSPSSYSPSILSPCVLCRKRKKRYLFLK